MPSGGKREHNGNKGGRPKGTTGIPHASTLNKVQAREYVREYVMSHMPAMLKAQVAHSQGIGHLFTRDKKGKFTKIENEAQALDLLEHGEEGKDFYIFMKDPSVQAFTDLLNRTLDKPREQEQTLVITGELALVSERLQHWRKRKAQKA
jgi:hypothetical protein